MLISFCLLTKFIQLLVQVVLQDSEDASNMFKPALARGELQCIGATTLDEYRTNIEKDGALERRFQKVIVEPTNIEETLRFFLTLKKDMKIITM